MIDLLIYLNYLAIIYFAFVNLFYIFLNFRAYFSLKKQYFIKQEANPDRVFKSEFYKPLSIIVPAYNEEETIIENLNSILSLRYPEFEVIVVNDGSKDDTLSKIIDYFNLQPSQRSFEKELQTREVHEVYHSLDYPNLIVIDKNNGGKADSLNAGINTAHFPLICSIDADSLIESSALLRMVEPFVQDRRVVAAGGTVRIANDSEIERGEVKKVSLPKNSLPRFQLVEYLRAFLFGRVGWAVLESLLIISGAFGIFRRRHVIDVGGYRTDTVGEDMELVLRLHRYLKKNKDYRVVFLADPVCWTQVPEDIKSLGKQRRRWQQGLAQSLFMNWEIFFNKDYGLLGVLAFPFFFFVELLGPIFELIGYLLIILLIISGFADFNIVILFFTTSILLGVLLSTSSLLFEELTFRKYEKLKDMLILFVYAILENFGYRQLNNFWRLQGIIDYLRKRDEWGAQKRKSFNK